MSNDLVLTSTHDGVTTLVMNNPRKLNGWTQEMMAALKQAFLDVAADDATQAVVLTGADPYYSAGVNLGGTMSIAHPKTLHRAIVEHNQALFDAFLNFPKPIVAAVNGPSIGAPVTSATLCDALIASEKATFSTPFARLGVAPEGCSSVHFARIMSPSDAERMLGPEGLQPTAQQAFEMGFADKVVPHDQVVSEAQALAAQWVADGKTRTFRGGSTLEELLEVNARESVAVADSFLGRKFLRGQAKFLWKKKKRVPALLFLSLWASHPVWGRLL